MGSTVKLRSQQDQWDQLGRSDVLWAILTDPDKKNGGWDEGEFLATGHSEIAELMARASALGLPAAVKFRHYLQRTDLKLSSSDLA